jgi:hypothetical protein
LSANYLNILAQSAIALASKWWPRRTVPELMFEKKGLIPAVQQLLVGYHKATE